MAGHSCGGVEGGSNGSVVQIASSTLSISDPVTRRAEKLGPHGSCACLTTEFEAIVNLLSVRVVRAEHDSFPITRTTPFVVDGRTSNSPAAF